jgi:hypothetical protein
MRRDAADRTRGEQGAPPDRRQPAGAAGTAGFGGRRAAPRGSQGRGRQGAHLPPDHPCKWIFSSFLFFFFFLCVFFGFVIPTKYFFNPKISAKKKKPPTHTHTLSHRSRPHSPLGMGPLSHRVMTTSRPTSVSLLGSGSPKQRLRWSVCKSRRPRWPSAPSSPRSPSARSG